MELELSSVFQATCAFHVLTTVCIARIPSVVQLARVALNYSMDNVPVDLEPFSTLPFLHVCLVQITVCLAITQHPAVPVIPVSSLLLVNNVPVKLGLTSPLQIPHVRHVPRTANLVQILPSAMAVTKT